MEVNGVEENCILKIDLEELIAAMEDARRDYSEYFLDRKTGEVVVVPEELLRTAQYEDLSLIHISEPTRPY